MTTETKPPCFTAEQLTAIGFEQIDAQRNVWKAGSITLSFRADGMAGLTLYASPTSREAIAYGGAESIEQLEAMLISSGFEQKAAKPYLTH